MPAFKQLPDDVLDSITKKVGDRLSRILPATLGSDTSIRLHETIDIWTLDNDALIQPTDDLIRLAKRTGRWHHQIKVNNVPQAYAQSLPQGADPDTWLVVGVFSSDLAKKIDEVVDFIDHNDLINKRIAADAIVRLLVIPTYYLHAFWLLDDKNQIIVIIEALSENERLPSKRVFLSSSEFLSELRSIRPAQGLIY